MSQKNKPSALDSEFDALMKQVGPKFEGFTKEEEAEYKQMLAKQGADRPKNRLLEQQTGTREKHEIFIREMIAHGNRRLAYLAAYPSSSNGAATTSACRLLSIPYIAHSIQKGLLAAKQLALQSLQEQYSGHMADIIEKRKILARIIRGELVAEKEIVKADGEKQRTRTIADPKDCIRAIMLDNRMEEEWKQAVAFPDNGVRYAE